MKFTFAFFLALAVSNNAMAKVSECFPATNYGSPTEIAEKAVLNINGIKDTITVTLKDGKSVSGALVDASEMGPGAQALNEETAAQGDINATVVSQAGRTFVLISPLMAMSIPQQLICR